MKSSHVIIVPPSLRDAETCINGTCGEIPQISGDVRIPSIGVCPKYQIYKKAKTQQILNLKHIT